VQNISFVKIVKNVSATYDTLKKVKTIEIKSGFHIKGQRKNYIKGQNQRNIKPKKHIGYA
tara:strand:- start:1187 stop:1366 length:180 start_codon:yes stop_codon:yes gene_type:complete